MAGNDQMDAELQRFLAIEGQKAKFQQHVHNLTDICWDKCIEKSGSKLESKQQACLSNCVGRFIDVSNFVINRLSQKSG
uniref:Mitochondrial import inner membrane translocase subunit n=1 Tax=Hydra vulgaris TaxID=6087 RepID=T2MJ00_HYDVU